MSRYYHTLICDPTRGAQGTFVLFGGTQDEVTALGDTWEYDIAANTWEEIIPDTATPDARWGAMAAFDGDLGVLVLYGGTDGSTVFSDTWTWNGSNWELLSPTHSPGPRAYACAAGYDPDGQPNLCVYFGWDGSAAHNDFWEFNISGSGDWTQLNDGTGEGAPPARMNAAGAFGYGGVAFFGGQSSPSDAVGLNDWGYGGGEGSGVGWSNYEGTAISHDTGEPIAPRIAATYLGALPVGDFDNCDGIIGGETGGVVLSQYTAVVPFTDESTQWWDTAIDFGTTVFPPAQYGSATAASPNYADINSDYVWGGSALLDANAESFWYWDHGTNDWVPLAPSSPGGPGVGSPGPAGGGPPPVVPGIVSASPTNWRTVRFVLTTAPQFAVTPHALGDALNPESWTLRWGIPKSAQAFTPISVVQVDAVTFDVSYSTSFPSHLITLYSIINLYFDGVLIPLGIGIQGMQWAAVSTPSGQSAQKRQVTTDLANPPGQGLANSGGTGGTLQIQGGDYANVTGDAFVKKMIYRLLVTLLGGFFHLPAWGTGILNPKGLISPSGLLAAKGNLELAIRNQIPEVAKVQVQLQLLPTGVLFVTVNAVTQPQGNAISVSASSQPVLPGAGGGYVSA